MRLFPPKFQRLKWIGEVIASSFYAHLNPTLVDFGELSESTTYVFSFKAAKGGASLQLLEMTP